jgi:membrane protease YdiL (CAAX protease family)
MDTPSGSRPWNPNPAWADPLIALLAVVALLLSSLILARRQSPPPAAGAGLQGRLAELPFAAARALPAGRAALLQRMKQGAVRGLEEPWDRAVLGVLRAAEGDLQEGRRLVSGDTLAGSAGAPFRRCWARAFEGAPAVSEEDRGQVRKALGAGWAAAVLDDRLDQREGRDPGPALRAAQTQALQRLAVVTFAGFLLLAGCAGGAAFGIYLAVARPGLPAPLPGPAGMGPRAFALMFLGWFLGLLAAGTLVSSVVASAPFLTPFSIPLAYTLHAVWGGFLICSAQGRGFRQVWSLLTPGPAGRALLWGVGFLALALPAVLLMGLFLGPFLRQFPPPQRELLEALARLRSPLALILTGGTVAFLAPAFEELLFRGTVLPWAVGRLGWTLGLLATSVVFGLMHLQLAGLPTLSVLGLMLGLAFRQGNSLWAPILVHGLWNGGVFLFLRALTA